MQYLRLAMKRFTTTAAAFIGVLGLAACQFGQETDEYTGIQSGDIAFVGSTGSALGNAIDAVTQGKGQTHFTHIGMVEVAGDALYILHSNSYNGVCKELIDSFKTKNVSKNDSIYIYRIQDMDSTQLANAVQKARSLLGQPYNSTYVLADTGFYCSEFVYRAFEKSQIFQLYPMTFIDPETNTYHDTWVKHYEQLGMEIPEGKAGCNPNGMAANARLVLVKAM